MPNVTTHIALLFPVAILSLLIFLPWLLSRDGLLLGIHVTEEFRASAEARQLHHRYARNAALISLCAITLAAYSSATSSVWFLLGAVGVDVAGIFVLWISTWRRLHLHRATQFTVRAAEIAPQPGGRMPWAVTVLAALLPVGGASTVLAMQWQSIPERFPIHWGANGQANGWSERTPMGVFGVLILGTALIVLFAILGEVIPRVSSGFQGSKSVVHLTRNLLCACGWMLGLLFSAISLLPLMHDATRVVPLVMISVFVLIGMIVVYMIAGARRIMPAIAAAQDSTPDRYWLGGIFYFNPGDPAVMVPKRLGVGYTLNLGRPVSWVVVSGLLILPVVLPVILQFHKKH
ncbi:MAG TPA: DUF5808 domain-containing protein [Acidobacteriaceae bacterium]|nr:DUF5808 domain-containing protein [Acidobacteriaceae bacterium]